MTERTIGHVTHYYGRSGAAAVAVTDTVRVGDLIHVVGHPTDESSEIPAEIAEVITAHHR